jgi:hypothetical protein
MISKIMILIILTVLLSSSLQLRVKKIKQEEEPQSHHEIVQDNCVILSVLIKASKSPYEYFSM